ncbi:Hypothetical predicted protein [Podarcis lilfordi]|uniref:Uncharacterized protein n=1 Tax=Podarcis lilfordi TaxID=74358 RepID=A0AA35KSG8_9SAUR|nr:Hypothetical predicted protein [Podarcis lilfordi]
MKDTEMERFANVSSCLVVRVQEPGGVFAWLQVHPTLHCSGGPIHLESFPFTVLLPGTLLKKHDQKDWAVPSSVVIGAHLLLPVCYFPSVNSSGKTGSRAEFA